METPSSKPERKKLSADEQAHKVRLQTLGRIYEQADRVITSDPIVVNIAEDGPAPAWSDGKSITFNMSDITEFDIEELSQLNGLNYHELCHHEYTPRKSSELVTWVLDNNLMRAFNILEDQRIETLMCGRFPAVVPYLQATIARWLAQTPQDVMTNYIVVRGRRYLDPKVTAAFRDHFIMPALLPEIARIVDEYRLLTFPQNSGRAKVLVREFQDNVLDKLPMGCGPVNPCPTDTGQGVIPSGRPQSGKDQERDVVRVTRTERDGDEIITACNFPRIDEDGELVSDDTKSSATNNATTAIMDADDQIAERNEQAKSDGEFSLKPGAIHMPSQGGIPDDLGKILDRSIEEALSRKDVQADIRSKQRVLLGGDGKHSDEITDGVYDKDYVPLNVIRVAHRFQRELEKLRSDSEPYWETELPTGRLNIPRVIRGCEIDQAFDRWDEGNDSTDMEVVILVDRSGSMGSHENDRLASQACWVIKRAMEAIDAPVTVYAFDDKGEVAYSRTDKADRVKYKMIFGRGGTNPLDSLLEAERLFLASRSKSKLLFLITDGAFNGGKTDEAISRMADRGVLTSMVLLMRDEDMRYYAGGSLDSLYHGAEIKARIDSAALLIPFARSVVINAIKKRIR